jgi:serine/threonine-protein kinase
MCDNTFEYRAFMSIFRARNKAGPGASVSPESVKSELARVLRSSTFAAAERHRRFLRFVVEETIVGRREGIKEAVLALEVFDRGALFDPRTDSVVRSEARNLRARLNEYYLGEGRADPVVIELPKGTYAPLFHAAVASAASSPGRRVPRWLFAAVGVLVTVIVLGSAWWLLRSRAAWQPSAVPPALAVLPFLNLSGGAGSDYVADGFVEDLTTQLALHPGLRVAARTSAFQFRGKNEDVRQIGRQLGVSAVLEGSLRNEGAHLRITAQLISAATGYHLWSGSFACDLHGVQDAERDIETAVAGSLGVRQAVRPNPPHAPPVAARDAYWQGRYVFSDWRRRGDAERYLEQAVVADGQWADAWAALAALHATMAFHSEGPVEQEAAKARQEAGRALQLDETNPEAHTALAILSYAYDRDWVAAERSFRRAIDLDPSYAWAHKSYAVALTCHARFDDSLEQIRLAQVLDPVSVLSGNDLAAILYNARRYGKAIDTARRHLAMDPRYFPAHSLIGLSQAAKGNLADAISELEKAADQGKQYPELAGSLGNVLARAGRVAEANAVLDHIRKDYPDAGAVAVSLSLVHIGLGEKTQALAELRKAVGLHATGANFIGVEPIFDPLRADPAFQALCAEFGLPNHGPSQ